MILQRQGACVKAGIPVLGVNKSLFSYILCPSSRFLTSPTGITTQPGDCKSVQHTEYTSFLHCTLHDMQAARYHHPDGLWCLCMMAYDELQDVLKLSRTPCQSKTSILFSPPPQICASILPTDSSRTRRLSTFRFPPELDQHPYLAEGLSTRGVYLISLLSTSGSAENKSEVRYPTATATATWYNVKYTMW